MISNIRSLGISFKTRGMESSSLKAGIIITVSFFILNKNDGPWIFSASILTILANLLHTANGKYTGGEYYIAFVFSYMALLWLFNFRFEFSQKGFSPLGFMIGVTIILFGEPLFENDHYMYLFEGKVFFKGLNPYKHPPVNDIYKSVAYFAKEKISFNYLTTVYPPLALLWFGFASLFGFKIGVGILMLLNGGLVYWLYKKLFLQVKPFYLYLLIPFFQKEFVQGIHIDLLAAAGLGIYFFRHGI